MGITIKSALEYLKDFDSYSPYQEAIGKVSAYIEQMQADYNARLKADMVDALEDLKEQLREMHEDFFETEHFDEAYGVSDSMDLIEEKINSLKEAQE